ncbi:exocyst subunit exo70 family protein [Medicago truncatula]|uniref:Exocyst subunit Exo70 family protein n=1 Tax=Medicago truncatula TaxID=3880 RepID=G7K5P0_MEDTR|nr:exocyst subunit exo70 family protein [Medicago truncatula]
MVGLSPTPSLKLIITHFTQHGTYSNPNWRWMMLPKVWRFVGFASSVVGLLCYALSSSFNYLFGEWNLLKIFLYSAFSFIICLVILIYIQRNCNIIEVSDLKLIRHFWKTQCGFEIDLLYFFLGSLIVQLMKIKLQLFILGAWSSQYISELQDGNSVILYVDSLQSPSVNNNTSSSATNSIDSPQLVINTNNGSMMEQLRTCVKALKHDNLNLIQIISEHVKKYVEEHSQLVVTYPNLIMDALKPETMNDLEEIAKVMMMIIRLTKLNIEDVHNMSWKDLEDEIERWIRTFNVESTIKLLNFVDYVSSHSSGIHSPERLFKILEVFETLCDLIPELASLFCDQYNLSLRSEATAIWNRLGKTIRDIFKELEYLICRDLTKVTNFGGVCRTEQTLEQVFYDSSLSSKIRRIMDTLESNLEAKSKCYEDPSLGYISESILQDASERLKFAAKTEVKNISPNLADTIGRMWVSRLGN